MEEIVGLIAVEQKSLCIGTAQLCSHQGFFDNLFLVEAAVGFSQFRYPARRHGALIAWIINVVCEFICHYLLPLLLGQCTHKQELVVGFFYSSIGQ